MSWYCLTEHCKQTREDSVSLITAAEILICPTSQKSCKFIISKYWFKSKWVVQGTRMLIKSAKTLAQTVWFSQLKNDKSGLFLNWNKVLKIVVAYRWLYDEIKVFITKLALFSTTKDSKAVLCGGTPTTIISCNCKFILFLKFSCNKVCQSKTFMNRKFNFDVSKKIINDHIIFDISFNFNYYIIWYFAENFRNWKLFWINPLVILIKK